MQHRRYRAPHVPDHLGTTDRPRHEARLPVGQRLAQPFAYDPQSGMVIAPWQRGELPPDDEPDAIVRGARSDRRVQRGAPRAGPGSSGRAPRSCLSLARNTHLTRKVLAYSCRGHSILMFLPRRSVAC